MVRWLDGWTNHLLDQSLSGQRHMLIGAMNHPQRDIFTELQWMVESKLDFIDLSLEPPAGASWRVNVGEVRTAIARSKLHVVGHTAYYLPLASPFEELRQAAVIELRRCLVAFADIGAKWMNIHPDRPAPMQARAECVQRNLQSLAELLPLSQQLGVGLMLENLPGPFNSVEQMSPLLDAMPQLGLHLDIGHCNLLVIRNTAHELIEHYGDRIAHVHLHDNNGGHADLHLPLGVGSMQWQAIVRELKIAGYDGTITLEVFSDHRQYLLHSRDLLRRVWEERSLQ